MVQRRQQRRRFGIIGTTLNPDSTLTHSRQHDASGNPLADSPCHLQAQQSGGCENNGVKISIVQALQAPVYIATEVFNFELWKAVTQQ